MEVDSRKEVVKKVVMNRYLIRILMHTVAQSYFILSFVSGKLHNLLDVLSSLAFLLFIYDVCFFFLLLTVDKMKHRTFNANQV